MDALTLAFQLVFFFVLHRSPMPRALACGHRKAISTTNRMRERDLLLQLSVDREGVSPFVPVRIAQRYSV